MDEQAFHLVQRFCIQRWPGRYSYVGAGAHEDNVVLTHLDRGCYHSVAGKLFREHCYGLRRAFWAGDPSRPATQSSPLFYWASYQHAEEHGVLRTYPPITGLLHHPVIDHCLTFSRLISRFQI